MNAIPIGLALPIEDPLTKMAPSPIHVALNPSIPVADGLSSEEHLAVSLAAAAQLAMESSLSVILVTHQKQGRKPRQSFF